MIDPHLIMRYFVIITIALVMLSCSGKNEDPVALDINGEKITVAEFQSIFTGAASGYDKDLINLSENLDVLRRWVIDQLINEQLLAEEAKKRGLVLDENELKIELNALNGENGASEASKKQRKIWAKRAKSRLMSQSAIDSLLPEFVVVTPEEIKKYYYNHQAEFKRPAQCRFRQIITKDPEKAGNAKVEWYETKDFGALVEKYSEGPYRERKGDTGYIDRKLLPSFLGRACDNLEIGEVSDVLESPYGFCIVKLEDRRKARNLQMNDVKDEIKNTIMREKGSDELAKWLTEKRRKAFVVINWERINEISP